ncbi:MAG: contractile injection system tape measure protein [Smithella sp.]
MPLSSHHIIREQYLDIELNGAESDGLDLQRRLTGICEHRLTPAIERVLDRFGPPDGHLYIERLDIDMGAMSLEHVEQKLSLAVAEKLEKWLRENIPAGDLSSIIVSKNVRRETELHSINEAFIYFLKKGRLPWSFHLPAGSNLEKAVFDSWRQITRSGGHWVLKNKIIQTLDFASSRKRLVRQFTPSSLEVLLSLLSPAISRTMNLVLIALHISAIPPADLKIFEQYLWNIVFANLAATDILSARSLVGEAWRACALFPLKNSLLKNALEQYWPGVTNQAQLQPNQTNVIQTEYTGNAEKKSLPVSTTANLSATSALENQVPVSNAVKIFEINKLEPSVTKPMLPSFLNAQYADAEEDLENGIYLENAGLIILHPFLPQLFTALGISNDAGLLQPQRGLCLLHFLATGKTSAPEYELILPKILCNIPLELPVESDAALTEDEREEAVALLEAVIHHWEVLRNTSPDGLRGTFLLRPGKVSLRDDGDWLLQVEAQSFDILLDQLPWSISMIKLPWMEKILWVEWR